MTKQVHFTTALPLSSEQLSRLQEATRDFSSLQLACLAGYFWGRVSAEDQPLLLAAPAQPHVGAVAAATVPITLLSASQTGNARRLAEQLRDHLVAAQLDVVLINAGDYKFKQIAQEKLLIVVTSTHGDGDPPEEAVALYKYLFSKKAPALPDTKFAVFGLGDSSYEHFAKIGKDFDRRLEELGAQRLYDRVDADVDYQVQAEAWRTAMVDRLKLIAVIASPEQQKTFSDHDHNNKLNFNPYTKETPLSAYLLVRQKITSRQSLKDVRHLEIDLGDSALHYKPGDALGVWYENDPALICELLALLCLKNDEQVKVSGQTLSLSEALQKYYELTQNTPAIVEHYAYLAQDKALLAIVADKAKLQQFAQTTPIVDMVRHVPIDICSDQLLGLLRPLTPRLYSIASSQAEVGAEIHITVGVVRFEIESRLRTGGASGYLADRLPEGGVLRVFIEHNDNFCLPENPNTPVIMIGPGTGIAPFRSFLQQRKADGASGENWLFFGNPHFTDDFLYQVEWQRYAKEGILTKIDLAWSRDQAGKIYVQDKVRENGAELWRWITHGAHIYVCGEANYMARDVEQALVTVVAKHGGMNLDQADEFLSELRLERRYQRDVY